MGILQGSISFKRLFVMGPVPGLAELAEALQAYQFRPFQDGTEEERIGWCDWRNPLSFPCVDWVDQDRFYVLSLRVDTRRVPPAILKATVDLRIQSLMKEMDLAFIGKDARISLMDEVKAELLPRVMPTMRSYDLVWDRKGGTLYTTATSSKLSGLVAGIFMKSFGADLLPIGPLILAGRTNSHVSADGLMALDPISLEVDE